MSIFGEEVEKRDMPLWTQPLIPGRPHCYIKVTGRAEIPTNGTDYNVRYIYLKAPNGDIRRFSDTGYESAINDPLGLFFGVEGGPLPKGAEILIVNTHPKMVQLFTTEAMLPADNLLLPKELPERHQMILLLHVCLISRARPEYLRKMKAREWEIDELKTLGFLDKRGAVTLAGRKVAEAFRTRDGQFLQEWAAERYRSVEPVSALRRDTSEQVVV